MCSGTLNGKNLRKICVTYVMLMGNLIGDPFHVTTSFLGSEGRVAQSVGHLTRKSGVLGSIPGLATYFSFLLPLFQEGQLSVTGESMCTK